MESKVTDVKPGRWLMFHPTRISTEVSYSIYYRGDRIAEFSDLESAKEFLFQKQLRDADNAPYYDLLVYSRTFEHFSYV